MNPADVGYKKYLIDDFVDAPIKISGISKVDKIYSVGNYTYAKVGVDIFFSWGSGDNYVLGNIDECTEYVPYEIDNYEFIN